MANSREKIAVGLSGGVDSSVAAMLLLDAGYDVEGIFMKNWEEDDSDDCNVKKDYEDACNVCKKLGIKINLVNFSDKYWDDVFRKFIAELKQGYTPNPDIFCNKEIKFKLFFNYALSIGFDSISTGHYAKNIDKGSRPIKGVVNFLKWAQSEKIPMAVCTNKQERLAVDLLKKIKLSEYFHYIAGCDTFDFNKPDPRHLTNVVEILGGNINKTIMVGDSEVDSQSANNAKIPFILVEDGYTEKNTDQIPHDISIKNFLNFKKIIEKYL